MPPKRATERKAGLGRALGNDRRRRAAQPEPASRRTTGVAEDMAAKSVLVQNSLDDFLGIAELAQTAFDGTRGAVHIVEANPQLVVSEKFTGAMLRQGEGKTAICVPIPWRPRWREGISAEELADSEGEAFLEWRRGLARLEEKHGFIMTPYERNLNFWRHLWQCVDRSDLLVQVLDSRDPMFYRSLDLERYVEHFGTKRHLLLMNKADFLSPELRQQWADHFRAAGIDVIFFSALQELQRQQESPASASSDGAADEPPRERPAGGDAARVVDCTQLIEELGARLVAGEGAEQKRGATIGFVGYPNVGKSSVINALYGAKKVTANRTPGKTKHLQTLDIKGTGFTLCDCPGLVFPSIVATKAHLVINATMPIDELQDFVTPVCLIVSKVGVGRMLEKYNLGADAMHGGSLGSQRSAAIEDTTHAFLAGFATARQHFLKYGVPDQTWAARRVLWDYCSGELLHCEHPFGPPSPALEEAAPQGGRADASGGQKGDAAAPADGAPSLGVDRRTEECDDDFNDIDELLGNAVSRPAGEHTTRRKERQLSKRQQKDSVPLA